MKKKYIVFVVLIAFILFIGGFVFISKTINNYREDRKRTKIILSGIVDEYNHFESKIDPYNKKLKEIVNLLNENSYYEKIKNNEENIIKLLDEAASQIDELNSYESLKNNCNKKYADGKANRACFSYQKTYEKSVNLYVDIIRSYNNIINKTNELSDNKLSLYDATLNDYIDYNNDGVFMGKNVILKEKEVSKDE